jgi:hypothetical protein
MLAAAFLGRAGLRHVGLDFALKPGLKCRLLRTYLKIAGRSRSAINVG